MLYVIIFEEQNQLNGQTHSWSLPVCPADCIRSRWGRRSCPPPRSRSAGCPGTWRRARPSLPRSSCTRTVHTPLKKDKFILVFRIRTSLANSSVLKFSWMYWNLNNGLSLPPSLLMYASYIRTVFTALNKNKFTILFAALLLSKFTTTIIYIPDERFKQI